MAVQDYSMLTRIQRRHIILLYYKEKQLGMAEKYLNLGCKELPTKMTDKWRNLGNKKEKKYENVYLKNHQKYPRDLTLYYQKHYPNKPAPKAGFDPFSEKIRTSQRGACHNFRMKVKEKAAGEMGNA